MCFKPGASHAGTQSTASVSGGVDLEQMDTQIRIHLNRVKVTHFNFNAFNHLTFFMARVHDPLASDTALM